MEIITGRTNEPHILSEDEGALYASIFGPDLYVLPLGRKLKAEIVDANTIKINSGEFVMNGRFGRIRRGEYETVTIESGTAGYSRMDLIVVRYTNTNGIENFELAVIRGGDIPSETETLTPDWQDGNIYNGDTLVEAPLYAVAIHGVSVDTPKAAFKEVTANLAQAANLKINGNLELPGEIILGNSKRLLGMTTGDPLGSGSELELLGIQPCNENNNCVVGYGGYDAQIGQTNIYGNNKVMLKSNGDIDFQPGTGGHICKNGIEFIKYKDYKISYDQSAGDIGTRFMDKTVNVELSGYQALGAMLWNHTNNYYAMVVPYIAGTTLHVDGYRASGSARSGQSLTVTVLYLAK